MSRVHRLQHIQCLRTPALSHQDPVGTHAKRCADQLADRYFRHIFQIRGARLQPHQIRYIIQLQFC